MGDDLPETDPIAAAARQEPETTASFAWESKAHPAGPDGAVVRGEAAVRLGDLLRSLPDREAEAVRLRHLEGRSVADIAQKLGVPVEAVVGCLREGLRKLRGKMLETPSPGGA